MSVDSVTVDTEDWQGADSCTIGDVGGGLLGSEMVVGGFLHGDLNLPADANKEICGRITYWPPGLDLRTDEDGGIIASASDGMYVPLYQLYVDYAATGPETPLTFTFGAITAAAAWTEGAESFAATGSVSGVIAAALGWTEGAETFAATGTASVPAISGAVNWTEGAETFTAAGTVSAIEIAAAIGWTEAGEIFAAAGLVVNPIAIGAAWTEGAEVFTMAGISGVQHISASHRYTIAPEDRTYTI